MPSAFANISQFIKNNPLKSSQPKQPTSSFDTQSYTGDPLQAFSKAITKQESGNYQAVNQDSGALGAYQIMPYHLPEIGITNDQSGIQKFMSTPALQDQLHQKIITNLYTKYDGNFGKMAAAYYGGGGGASVYGTPDGDKPQGGGKYPSINAYVSSVMSKMAQIKSPAFNMAAFQDPNSANNQDVSNISPKAYNGIKSAMAQLGNQTVPFGGNTKYEGFHEGIDIANKIGTPIKSFAPGVVTDASTGHVQGENGYGNYIIITDPYGAQHRYSHLSQEYVMVGDKVDMNTPIAAMGNSGSTYSDSGGSGSHLDYRIKDAAGQYENPYQYLAKFYNQ